MAKVVRVSAIPNINVTDENLRAILQAMKEQIENPKAVTQTIVKETVSSATPSTPITTLEGVPVFIQDTTPSTTALKYFWIQTGLGVSGNDTTLWINF